MSPEHIMAAVDEAMRSLELLGVRCHINIHLVPEQLRAVGKYTAAPVEMYGEPRPSHVSGRMVQSVGVVVGEEQQVSVGFLSSEPVEAGEAVSP